MIQEIETVENSVNYIPQCQEIDCTHKNQIQQNIYCADCEYIICQYCEGAHMTHIRIESMDFNNIPRKQEQNNNNIFFEIPETENVSPIIGNYNQSSDSKMQSEDTLPDTDERKLKALAINKDFVLPKNILQGVEEDDDSESEEEDILKLFGLNNKIKDNNDSENSSDNDDSEMIKNFNGSNKIPSIINGGNPFSSPTATHMDDLMYMNSKSSIDSKAFYMYDQKSVSNQTKQKNILPQNGSNYLQIPSKINDFSNIHQQINNVQQNNVNSLSLSYQKPQTEDRYYNTTSFNRYNDNSLNIFSNQHSLTKVQQILQEKGVYSHLLQPFYQNNPQPKNRVLKKAAKTLVKKKKKEEKEKGGGDNFDESMMKEEEIPIPELEDKEKQIMLANVEGKSLNDIKICSKKVFDQLKCESDILFKEVKPHIHQISYQKDEFERINKYKKYAQEGVENYFRCLKDQFQIEYDKLKKCKKRDKLCKMMNKILQITEQYQHYKNQSEFANFLSRDYKKYFNLIKAQLNEVQNEGNDFPPSFKIVYENLYDIFETLISFISVNLPNQKIYNQFTQPIISINNTKSEIIPVHYPSKKLVGIWNCRTSEVEEIQYDCSQIQEFQKYRNYQIVNDRDFIYFIGGQQFNEEKNTFNPSTKCYKMSIHSGEIIPMRDMPQPKMKFGITLFNNQIYIFGGLITTEKHRTNTCEKFDIQNNTWKILQNMRKNRVCPVVSLFVKQNQKLNPLIYLFGGMQDKNNINYSIEVFDQKLEGWIECFEKPVNSKCYIPKQLGIAIQINYEQIVILGGMQGRKQKPCCGIQVYNTSKNSISNLSLDSLPTGIINDNYSSQAVIYNKSIYLLNTQISQYFPILKQLEGVCNVVKVGINQQEIIYTHCFQ